VHWFGSTASTTITVSAPPPFNSSQLIAANVPTTMTAGSYYNVSLTFKNTGNLTWTSPDYLLANPDDNFIWGLNRVSMSTSSVPPGQSTTFNFQVRAPTTAGTYPFQWGMVWEFHERFGQFGSSNITVNPPVTPKPGISASHTAMVAGQGFTMNWSTSDATSLSHVCTAAGTGYTVNESLPVNGSRAMTAQAGWVSYPSTCTWTASGPGGSTTYTETLTTTAGATPKPTINVARPSLVAGQSFTTSWSTTDATSLTHVCTAAGTGYNVNESLAVNGSRTLTAQSGWVGNPSSCTWTASGAGGTATYTETMTTVTGANGSVTYIHTDGLGSPVARTDASGTVISRTRYEPYGYVASGAMPTIGFMGHVNDADTGLTYMQQRYYDPVAGRFLSIDPVVTDVSTGGSFNRYAYANNNPYKYTDLDGRNPAVALGMGGAEVGTAVFPGVGTIIGGAIGAGVGWYLGDKAATWIASTVGGNRGSPMDVKDGTNPPTTIGGRDYSGHSQDRMQGRGVPPSAVEEAIKNGTAEASRGGTTVYTDSKNGVQVVVNADGKVVTVKHVKSDKGGGGNNNQNGPKKDDKPKEPDPKPPKTE
jgi:RHS repeat-associated protein